MTDLRGLALACLLAAASPAVRAVPAVEDRAAETWTVDATRVRARPSGFGRSLGVLAAGTRLTVLELRASWARVSDGKEAGWVRRSSLAGSPTVDEQPAAVPDEAVASADGFTSGATQEPVRPELGPSDELAAPASDAAAPGDRDPLVESGTHPKPAAKPRRATEPAPAIALASAGRSAPALPATPNQPPGLPAPAGPEVAGPWTSSPRLLGLRDRPSFAAALIGTVPDGSRVRVLERRGAWGWLRSSDGRQGWVVLAALQAPLLPRRP